MPNAWKSQTFKTKQLFYMVIWSSRCLVLPTPSFCWFKSSVWPRPRFDIGYILQILDQFILFILLSTGRLLTEDPNQRLGAEGASEVVLCDVILQLNIFHFLPSVWSKYFTMQVKAHPFFRDINWDTLARQKVLIVFVDYIPIQLFCQKQWYLIVLCSFPGCVHSCIRGCNRYELLY